MRFRLVITGLTLTLLSLGCNASELCEGAPCPSTTASNKTPSCSSGGCATGDAGHAADASEARANDASAQAEAGTLTDGGSTQTASPPDAALTDAQPPHPCRLDAGVCPTGAAGCGCDASTPVCSQSSSADDNHCVVCLQHEHCPLDAPYCTGGSCVACRPDANDCGPESPICDEGNCSPCASHDDCAHFDDTPLCDEPSGSCVECLDDEHCTSPGAARCEQNRCVPCESDAQCTHLPSQHLCHEGLCVQCYGDRTEACDPGRVCNMVPDSDEPYTCTHFQAQQADLCEPCVSDAHCRPGAHCVLTHFQGQSTGYFCLLREGGDAQDSPADCRDVQLYTGPQELTSTDGRSGRYCALERATCQALLDYGKPCEADDTCGEAGLDDGLCVPYSNTTSLCSYACSHERQCPGSVDCDFNKGYCKL